MLDFATRAIGLLLTALTVTAFANPSAAPAPRPATRVFISGHSLTDRPFPDLLAAVAGSLGAPIEWERQSMLGSSIKDRTRGPGQQAGWQGYRLGDNRAGKDLDVAAELKRQPYDILLITEQHGVVDSLVWNDTVRHLRHFHDRLIDGNPNGRTYFFEPWLGIPGGTDIRRWASYERRAAPVWRCIVARVNQGLAASGRPDRLGSLPASLALAALLERATQGPPLAGISAASPGDTIRRLFVDDVHLTPLAFYYLALVSHALIFDQSPLGASAPEGVSAVQARSLQQVAQDFAVRSRSELPTSADAAVCASALSGEFLGLYFAHRRDEYWSQQTGNALGLTAQRLKSEAMLRWRLHRNDPFAWTVNDKDYWFAAP